MTSLPNQNGDQVTLGIDVAKATLEVAISGRSTTLSIKNDEAGFAALIAEVRGVNVGLALFEATAASRSPALRRCSLQAFKSRL